MKKRVFAFALVLVLLCSLSVPAFAVDLKKNTGSPSQSSAQSPAQAQYKATQTFLRECAESDIEAEYQGVVSFAGKTVEQVYVTYSGDLSDYISHISVFFNAEGDELMLFMARVFTFRQADLQGVISDVNYYNANSVGAKLYVDEEDCSIDAEMYMIATPETIVDVAEVSLGVLIAFTDQVYEDFQVYDAA